MKCTPGDVWRKQLRSKATDPSLEAVALYEQTPTMPSEHDGRSSFIFYQSLEAIENSPKPWRLADFQLLVQVGIAAVSCLRRLSFLWLLRDESIAGKKQGCD